MQKTTLQTTRVAVSFSPADWEKLRLRAIKHVTSREGYIKKLVNNMLAENRLPPFASFFRLWPLTKTHPSDHIKVKTPIAPTHLRYLDTLAISIPPHYGTGAKTRRRLLETLTLIDLYDTGD